MGSLRGSLTGVLDGLLPNQVNILRIRLLETKMISFDLIFNDQFYNANMKDVLSGLEEAYTNYSDREMVYFICVRKKVRFIPKRCTARNITIGIYKDEERVEKMISVGFSEVAALLPVHAQPDEITFFEDKITFRFGENLVSSYVYDIYESLNIDKGSSSKIVYVGETDFPLDRPFDKAHLGMMRAIYNYKNLGNDIFIYYNLFQLTIESIEETPIRYIASNGLLNLLDKRTEARLVQNAFVWRLLSPNYSKNYQTEVGELKNVMELLRERINLKEIKVNYEVDAKSDIYRFHSDRVTSTFDLGFSVSADSWK